MGSVVQSATLAINERVEARRAAGGTVLHLGFGEAGLPVLPEIADVLAGAVGRNRYAPVAGSAPARAATAGWFGRRGLPTDPDQIVLAPGSKALLYALVASLPGDVVLPQPSWVSYAAQATLAHKDVVWVPVPDEAGGVPDPDLLGDSLRRARDAGRRPGILVLTLPDNPTGTVAPAALVDKVCRVAEEHDLAVVSDEIYRDLAYQPEGFVSPSAIVPERCFVTTGLSKSLALGGWRIGAARFPDGVLGGQTRQHVAGVASEVWSALADPMQEVVAYVMDEPTVVGDHVAASRALHRKVSTAVHQVFVEGGARCRPPAGGFYLYPDLEPLRPALAARGIRTGAQLADHLLDVHGVGVLAGESFGDVTEGLRFRAATSLLYGTTAEQRREALAADDPTTLPWIASSLDHLRGALAALAAG
jgi:aspartate aminotransferase